MLSLVIGIIGVSSCSDDEPAVAAPNAAFTSTIDGLTVSFTDASIGADSYSWDFGDGNTSTEASPTHTYDAAGTYTVELTVTNAGGSNSSSESVTVEAPLSDFLAGTWRIASEEGAMAVGPSAGSGEWWSLPAGDVEVRACGLNDDYVFGTDGSFSISQGDETWLEAWQEGVDADGCGAPIAPHDGSGSYTFEAEGSSFTLNGAGAYIGLAKVGNAGELPNVDVPASITYTIAESSDDAMTLNIEAGSGVHWTFKLVKAN